MTSHRRLYRGAAAIAFNDQVNLVPTDRPYVHFVQQVDRPRLL